MRIRQNTEVQLIFLDSLTDETTIVIFTLKIHVVVTGKKKIFHNSATEK